MYYKKVETYSFTLPREYEAYVQFKEDLKEAGIRFTETGGSINQIITITTGGRFTMEDKQWTQKHIS